VASLMLINPKKRRKIAKAPSKRLRARRRKNSVAGYFPNPIRKAHRKYRRNPISGGGMLGQLKSAGIGAAGALVVDIAMQKLPIPVQFKTGLMKNVAQGLISFGLGMLVAKVGKNKSLGMQLADGGLLIAMYSGMKNVVGPQLGLSSDLLGDDLLGDDDMDGYSTSVDGYDSMAGDDDYGMDGGDGWISPAPLSSY
jgi:hypothetical protein